MLLSFAGARVGARARVRWLWLAAAARECVRAGRLLAAWRAACSLALHCFGCRGVLLL